MNVPFSETSLTRELIYTVSEIEIRIEQSAAVFYRDSLLYVIAQSRPNREMRVWEIGDFSILGGSVDRSFFQQSGHRNTQPAKFSFENPHGPWPVFLGGGAEI